MAMSHEDRAKRRKKIADFCKKHTVEQAAAHFGVSAGTATKACEEHGVKMKKAALSHKERAARRREIAEFCRTHTKEEACAAFGVSEATADVACREYGVRAVQSNVPMTKVHTLKMLKLLMDGYTQSSIAQAFGVTASLVNQLAQKAREAGFKL